MRESDNLVSHVCGLSVRELIEVKCKLECLGLDLSEIIEFLDRDKVQLFAELKSDINMLEKKLRQVRNITAEEIG